MKYRTLGETNYEYRLLNENNEPNQINGINKGNFQTQVIDDGDDARFYTSAVFDMTDNFNQATGYFGTGFPDNNRPQDNVTNIPITNVEDAIIMSRSWNQFRDRVINGNGGRQAQEIRELFANW